MIEHSEQLNELAAALSAAQATIQPALKDSTNPHFKTKYADLSSVWSACRDALTRNGLSVLQSPGFDVETNAVFLTTTLLHKSGQWIRGTAGCRPKDGTPQSVGGAVTYLRRYGLAALLGVVADEDDDGESAQPRAQAKAADGQITQAQVRAVEALCKTLGKEPDAAANHYYKKQVHALTLEEGNGLLDALKQLQAKAAKA